MAGCGGTPAAPPPNHTFFADEGSAAKAGAAGDAETPYPRLDDRARGYVGVSILGGLVHLRRREDWTVRAVGREPGNRYVQYISPRQFIFAVYELPQPPGALWRDVLTSFEAGVTQSGGQLVGRRIPAAAGLQQARAYVIRRPVRAARGPLVTESHELVTRGEERVVLVQITHPPGAAEGITPEVLPSLDGLEVR